MKKYLIIIITFLALFCSCSDKNNDTGIHIKYINELDGSLKYREIFHEEISEEQKKMHKKDKIKGFSE